MTRAAVLRDPAIPQGIAGCDDDHPLAANQIRGQRPHPIVPAVRPAIERQWIYQGRKQWCFSRDSP
jgi:hypothetical protein